MTANTWTTSVKDIAGGFDEAADRVRTLNETFIETAKKTGGASLDAYEQALTSFVDFQRQVAGATQLEWVNTVVQAQTTFLTEISGAYVAAARKALN